MAEGDGAIYNNFKEQILLKQISMTADTLKVALYNSSFTLASIDGAAPAYTATNELSGTGYTAGGAALASKTVAQDDTNDRASFDAADTTWTGLDAGTPAYAVLYDDTTATKWLIARWEVTTPSNGGDYTLQWHTDGIILLS